MFDTMFQYFGAGVATGMALGVIVWLITYACVSLIHVLKSMSDG